MGNIDAKTIIIIFIEIYVHNKLQFYRYHSIKNDDDNDDDDGEHVYNNIL